MKIKTNTPDLLIVEDRPWLFGLLLGAAALGFAVPAVARLVSGDLTGLLFLLGSAAMMLFFFLFVRRTQVVLHGPQNWAEIRQQSLSGYTCTRHDLSSIERAIVETSSDTDGGETHRLTLMIPSHPSGTRHPVTQVYSSGRGAHRSAEAINAWLDSRRHAT